VQTGGENEYIQTIDEDELQVSDYLVSGAYIDNLPYGRYLL
jgi:hypothetical protein